jgi:hypothetical protein
MNHRGLRTARYPLYPLVRCSPADRSGAPPRPQVVFLSKGVSREQPAQLPHLLLLHPSSAAAAAV